MAVGLSMFIREARWAEMRGLRRRPWKVDESVSGALEGAAKLFEVEGCFGADCFGNVGFEENREEIICAGFP